MDCSRGFGLGPSSTRRRPPPSGPLASERLGRRRISQPLTCACHAGLTGRKNGRRRCRPSRPVTADDRPPDSRSSSNRQAICWSMHCTHSGDTRHSMLRCPGRLATPRYGVWRRASSDPPCHLGFVASSLEPWCVAGQSELVFSWPHDRLTG